MIHANRKLPGFLFLTTLTATLTLVAAAQTNSFQEAAAQTPSFHGLGQMPGVWPAAGTYASAISADGSTIMGYGWVCLNGGSSCNSSDTVLAYRWTVAGRYQILGSRGNSDFFGAGAVSSNGSVIVGEHPLRNNSEAFRWTAAHGMVRLPMNIAIAVTGDGAMVAGGDNWWKTSGQTGIFGPFPGEQDQTAAYGLSGTGQAPVAVGAAIKGSNAFGPAFHAFRWTPAGGLQDLGLTTGTESFATAISANGLVIVGRPGTRVAFGGRFAGPPLPACRISALLAARRAPHSRSIRTAQ